jgi:Tfp pilus assembly protein PilF
MFLLRLCIIIFLFSSCKSFNDRSEERSELRLQLGTSYLRQGNYPLALKELLAAEELAPKNPQIQNNLGLLYFAREKYDLSAKHFARAYEFDNKYTDAKNNLARVQIELKQYASAERLLKEVSADLTYQFQAKADMNYGLLEFSRGRYKEAKTHFRKVLQQEREDCFAQVFLGRTYLELKETSQAVDQLEKATTFCKMNGIDDAHYFAAIALYRTGDKDQSLVRFKEAVSLFPQGKYRDQSKKMIDIIEKGAL